MSSEVSMNVSIKCKPNFHGKPSVENTVDCPWGNKGCFLCGCLFWRGGSLTLFICSSLANKIKLNSHLECEKSGLYNVCVFSWMEAESVWVFFFSDSPCLPSG